MKQKKYLDLSVIIPVYNVSTILYEVLSSLKKQEYPIKEIIIIDNHSTDNSVEIAKKFKQKNKKFPMRIIERKKTFGISSSYNLGAKLAKGKYIVTLHSDSSLPTKFELAKLVKPIEDDSSVIASYPLVVHSKILWLKYNFWQKCLFSGAVGKENYALNGKFDCYSRKIYLKIGGYDEKKFNHYIGSEDADMHIRLKKYGKVVPTQARVIHLHSFEKNYSWKNWVERRRFLAFTYGIYIRWHWNKINLFFHKANSCLYKYISFY